MYRTKKRIAASLLSVSVAMQLAAVPARADAPQEVPLPTILASQPGPQEPPEPEIPAMMLLDSGEDMEQACQDAQARFEQAEREALRAFDGDDAFALELMALDGTAAVVREGQSVYANGIPILIRADGGQTYIFDESGANKLLDEPIDASVSVFGGGKTADVDSTRVILESGTIANLIGGGRTGSVSGQARVELKGGAVDGLVCGGGKEEHAETGSTSIVSSGGPTAKWVYGGGYDGPVAGNTSLSLAGGTFEYVCGGGFSGAVGGNTQTVLENVTVSDTVFGGGWGGAVTGAANVDFGSQSSAVFLCGGGYKDQVGAGTQVRITGGSVSQTVYGGGWSANVTGDALTDMQGGVVHVLYGGGYEGRVSGQAEARLSGGTVENTVYGGGQQGTATTGATKVALTGATAGWVYGGGMKGSVSGAAQLVLDGAQVRGVAYGGGQAAAVDKSEVTLKGESSVPVLYCGGHEGAARETSLTVTSGTAGSVYGGGRETAAQTESVRMTVSGGRIDYLYGGGYAGAVTGTVEMDITGGVIQSAYGGGADGSVRSTGLTLTGGQIGWVYAGGKNGAVMDTTQMEISGTCQIENNAFGGGRGAASTVQNATVTVNGGEIRSVFAGGDQGTVNGSATLAIDTQNQVDFVCGGAYSGRVSRAQVTLQNGTAGTLYGGSYTGVTSNAQAAVVQGEVRQLVCGDGGPASTTQAEIVVSGGLVSELYPGYRGALRLCVDGGSLPRTYTGESGFVNSYNMAVYPVKAYVGNPVQAGQPVQCTIGTRTWTSKTDVGGKLTTYLPEGNANIEVLHNHIKYTGQIYVKSDGSASGTLLPEGAQSKFLVTFGVKAGNGALTATVDGQPVISGTSVDAGKTVVFQAQPDAQHQLKAWWYNGTPVQAVSNTYTASNLSGAVSVMAEFGGIVSYDSLEAAILQAEAQKAGVAVSLDGADVDPADFWVPRDAMDTFQRAIQTAVSALENFTLTQAEIDGAVQTLNAAISAFQAQKHRGQHSSGEVVDRQALNKKLTEIGDSLSAVAVSADGSDVAADKYWVTQAQRNAFQSVIDTAKAVAQAPTSTQEEVNQALSDLEQAEQKFAAAKKPGTKKAGYNVTFGAAAGGTLTASVSGQPVSSPYFLKAGQTMQLTATPNPGKQVAGWTSNTVAVNGQNPSLTLSQIDEDVHIEVTFQDGARAYQASVDSSIIGGIVSLNPSGMVYPGTQVQVTVLPDQNYMLQEGSLQCNGAAIVDNRFVMPQQDAIVTARFVPTNPDAYYMLTLSAETGGTVSGAGSYQPGQQVEIRAVPNSGYTFSQWRTTDSAYLQNIRQAVTQVTMPAKPIQITAEFTRTSDNGDTSGGGSAGGSTGTDPKKDQAVAPKPSVQTGMTIEGKGNGAAGIVISCKPDTTGAAILTLKADDMRKAVRAAQSGSTAQPLVIEISADAQQTGDTLRAVHYLLSKEAAQALNSANLETMRIYGADGVCMQIDGKTLASITPVTGDTLQLSIRPASDLSEQARKMLGGRPAFQFVILTDGRYATNFGGVIRLDIPYVLRDGERAEDVKGCYIDAAGKGSVWQDSGYDPQRKSAYLNVNHFSVFGVTNASDTPMPTLEFTDIAGHWAAEDILYLVQQGAVHGIGDDKFDPEGTAERGMLVAILGRLAGARTQTDAETGFKDVPKDAYYAPYVIWANEAEIAQGTGNGIFQPTQPVTREQLAVMLYAFAQQQGYALSGSGEADFADAGQISPWAAEAVAALHGAGIISGKSGKRFAPQETATRAEICAMLARMMTGKKTSS